MCLSVCVSYTQANASSLQQATRIDVAKWDADKQRVKNGCTNKLKQSASEINADLLKYYTEIQNVFKEFEVQETMPTTKQLKDEFNLRMKDTNEEQQEESQISFWEVFDEFVNECGNQNNWTASTYEKFAAVRNHLKEFKEDITFEYFNEFGLNEYVNFLRDKKNICCFTSLRYSDVRNLKRIDVNPDHIEVTTVKTADSLIFELNDHSKAILEKYKDVHRR